jgi:hypothetical protein
MCLGLEKLALTMLSMMRRLDHKAFNQLVLLPSLTHSLCLGFFVRYPIFNILIVLVHLLQSRLVLVRIEIECGISVHDLELVKMLVAVLEG